MFARRTWELVPCTDMAAVLLATDTSTLLNLGRGLTNLPPSGLVCPLYPWVLWYLWKARNRLTFENQVMQEQEVVTLALREARNWQAAQLLKRPPAKPPQTKNAHRDPGRSLAGLVCLVDASWQASTHFGGMGWVFKDSPTGWSSSNTSNCSHVASALMSEALAVKAAITDAASRNFKILSVCSDSKTLMDCINTQGRCLEVQGVLNDISALCAHFESISFHFISRSFNTEADSLAKISLQDLVSRIRAN